METDEKKAPEGNEAEKPAEDTGTGDKSETDKEIEKLNVDTERLNKAIAEHENTKARAKLGGVSYGNQEREKPKVISDVDYANAALKGKILK